MTIDSRVETEPALDWTEAFFAPRAIAVIGASDDPVKISGRPIDYLQRFGYQGRIIPINPRRDTVQGLQSWPSLDAVDGPIDLAMILTGAETCVDALRACAARRIPAAVIGAAGFAEIGGFGAQRQRELAAIAAETGIRVIGPNCTGVMSLKNAVTATFSTSLDRAAVAEQPLREGTVGFVSQSGGIGGFILAAAQRRGIGFSQYFTTGNEVDLTVSEVAELLADRPDVSMIMSYVEGLSDGDVFVRAAERARDSATPIIAVKAGKSDQGAAAVSSHTGALASPGRVFDSVAEQFGVIQAESMEQLVDHSVMFSANRRPTGRRMTIVSMSGGLAVLGVDAAADAGLRVDTWSPEWASRMAEAIPAYGNPRNPIDLTAALIADPDLLRRALAIAVDHPETDSIVIMLGNTDTGSEAIVDAIVAAYHRTELPMVVVWSGGSGRPRTLLAEAGVPCFADPRNAVRSLAALTDWSLQQPLDRTPPRIDDVSAGRAIIATVRAEGRRQLDEHESAQLFAAYGIPSMPSELVATPDECVTAAQRLGGRVVVKVASTKIAHKSDIGGVVVDPQGTQAIRAAGAAVLAAAAGAGVADAKILVQAMAAPGLELVAGVQRDPVFGPMVVAGMGGTLVEVLDDVQMVRAPVSVDEADAALSRLRAAALFDGRRGKGPYSRGAAAEVVARLSVLATDLADDIAELDVNPLIVGSAGAIAVDGLVVLTEAETP